MEVSFILNATEDEEKVVRRIGEFTGTASFSRVEVKGYYGNLLQIFSIPINENAGESILGKILKLISEKDLGVILTSLGSSIDKNGNLHLRLDKQSMLEGSIGLSKGDPLKIKIIPRSKQPISLNWPEWYRHRLEDLRKQY